MSLDSTTLAVALVCVYLANLVFVVLLYSSRQTFAGSRLWIAAQALLFAGALCQSGRGSLVPLIPVVIGNTCLLAALLVFAHSIWSFRFAKRFPLELYLFLPLIFWAFFITQTAPLRERIMLYSFFSAVGSCFTAGVLLKRSEDEFRWANRVTALPFLMVGLASAGRLVLASLGPPWSDSAWLMTTSAWFYLGAIVIAITSVFGYLMMTGIRSDGLLRDKDREIEKRNQELTNLIRSKDLFFSIIAHDLRGPIGGAARYARKHLFGKMSGLEHKYQEVETLAAALEKTNDFLEKLLWWSRSQLEDWNPTREPVDVDRVLRETENVIRQQADEKDIHLHFAAQPLTGLWANHECLCLILTNLLSNAIKFSFPGTTVQVDLRLTEQRGLISVIDEGVGMAPETLDRLFLIQDKLSSYGTGGEQGSGLGLILCQSLAARNGGGIEVSSYPGRGTRATLWLPLSVGFRPRPSESSD